MLVGLAIWAVMEFSVKAIAQTALTMVLALLCAVAQAEEPHGCDKFKWPIVHEQDALNAPGVAVLAVGGVLPLNAAASISLLPLAQEHLTWGVSGQAHHAAVPRTTSASVTHCEVLSLAPAAGASPAKRGEAQRSRERSDLDPPAAGYTVASERALARSWLPLRSLPRSFILTLRILLLRLDPKREPVFRHAALTAASPHIRSSLWGSDHNPSCSRASGSGWRDHPVKRRVSAREFIRGHRPPGSGEAVAFSFAGMGLSH